MESKHKLLSFHECLRWKFLIFGITRREWWRLVAIVLDDIFTSVKADLYQSALRTWLTVARWRIFICFPPASLLHYEFTGNQITSQLAVQSSLGVTLQHFSFDRGGLPPPPSSRLCILNRKHSQWYWLTSEEILGKYSFCMLEIPIFQLFQANNEAIFTNH